METMEKEKIRATVRDRYGSIAKAGNDTPETWICRVVLFDKRYSKERSSLWCHAAGLPMPLPGKRHPAAARWIFPLKKWPLTWGTLAIPRRI